jgi:trehalose 6-phosphate synthase/phosphatase
MKRPAARPYSVAESSEVASSAMGSLFRAAFPNERFVVVSNREPYEHHTDEETGQVQVSRPAGGLTSALDPILQSVGGVWIAWGSGDADAQVVDENQRVRVPPETPAYTLRRLWLDERDIHDYYLGYANQTLWPLCHLRPALTRVRARYWDRYQQVNERFARAVLEECGEGNAAVWFQDYHLATAPAFVRAARKDISLAHFWHIPWPPVEIFRAATRAREIVEGLLANDMMGFQLAAYGAHFLDAAEQIVGAAVDRAASTAEHNGHVCHVHAFPISIDIDQFRAAAQRPGADEQLARLRARYAPAGARIGVGVDRIDYTKGLEEKLKALDILWESHPELCETFTFVQVAVPSRTEIEAYDWLNDKVERMVWSINDRFGTDTWRPIHLVQGPLSADRLALLYREADFCFITSLQDGMNLVAKEYVASQVDANGVLLLSTFAGAVEELEGCIPLNPFDPEQMAQILGEALLMPLEERARRMRQMQAGMASIFDWLGDVFRAWGDVCGRGGAGTRTNEAA